MDIVYANNLFRQKVSTSRIVALSYRGDHTYTARNRSLEERTEHQTENTLCPEKVTPRHRTIKMSNLNEFK